MTYPFSLQKALLITLVGALGAFSRSSARDALKHHLPAKATGLSDRDLVPLGGQDPEMVIIPPGKFLMGSSPDEPDRHADEGPQHEVSIKRFALGKYPVTRAEFTRFVDATGYRTDAENNVPVPGVEGATGCFTFTPDTASGWKAGTSWRSPGFAQAENHPVTCVSWNDAQAYVDWLRKTTGKPYRLPSEAETEYATRAGGTARFPWGRDAEQACHYANIGDASAKRRFPKFKTVTCDDGYVFTSPVGHYTANAFGLYDMTGNVWEWVQDCWSNGYDGAPVDGSAQTSRGCDQRGLRGASWNDEPAWLRSTTRGRLPAAHRFNNEGLRVAQDL